jgi:signal transduction histidine kinase
MLQSRDGSLWVVGDRGLLRFRGGQFEPVRLEGEVLEEPIHRLARDRDGHLWAATARRVIRIFLGPTGRPLAHRAETAPFSGRVFDIAVDFLGNLIVSGPRAVWQYTGAEWSKIADLPAVADSAGENRIFLSRDGAIWVFQLAENGQASGMAIVRIIDGYPIVYYADNGMEAVVDLAELEDGTLLAATNNGVRRFADEQWVPWGVGTVIESRPLRQIVRAPDGASWLLTHEGVYRYAILDRDPPRILNGNALPKELSRRRAQLSVRARDRWKMSEPVSLQVRVDGGEPREHPADQPVELRDLTEGAHVMLMVAEDAQGNRQVEPFIHAFSVRPTPWARLGRKGLRLLVLISVFFVAIPSVGYAFYKHRRLSQSMQKLQHANERLLQADMMKSDFVANVSHELRTPLTAIKGFVDNLLDGIGGPVTDKQVHSLERVKVNADRLGRLINDLLDLRRIESGRLELYRTAIQLEEVAAGAVSMLQTRADEKNIGMTLEANGKCPPVWADRDRIAQVYTNIIGNALKFTPDGGTIRVSVKPEGRSWVYTAVSDSGPGISTEDQKRIFDRFHQAHGTGLQKAQGAGLGLGICRELIRLNGGTIGVRSEPGGGSEFYFRLPVFESPRGRARNE